MEGHTLNLLKDYSDTQISSMAFNTGRLIEHIINNKSLAISKYVRM